MTEPMAGFRIGTARKLARMAGATERRPRKAQPPRVQAIGPPGEAEIYKVHSGGIAARVGTTIDYAECTLQTIDAGELVDASPTVNRDLYNLSPNKIEGLDPSDGTSPMYCLGWPIAGGFYIASPMPWKTAVATMQINTKWDGDGLSINQSTDVQLPIHTADGWDVIAAQYDCDADE